MRYHCFKNQLGLIPYSLPLSLHIGSQLSPAVQKMDDSSKQINEKGTPPPIDVTPDPDLESAKEPSAEERDDDEKVGYHGTAFKNMGFLDRFLAIWIFLAMAIGIILGNFVPSTTEALQKGKFVGVSVPIGER